MINNQESTTIIGIVVRRVLKDAVSRRYERKSLGETEASRACPARTRVTQLKSTHQGGIAENDVVNRHVTTRGQITSVPVLSEFVRHA